MFKNAGRKFSGFRYSPSLADARLATDYIKAIPDGIRPYVPARYKALGTYGFGRSDYRKRLRAFFEVDLYHVAVAALKALADDQLLPAKRVSEAIAKYKIDPERPSPARS